MLNALTASLFLPEFILTLGWCSAKSEAYTLKQRWTKLWWQSHCFQDILRELTQPKTKASPAGAKVVAYSHWLTVHYICLCSHINTLAAQPTHGRARQRAERKSPRPGLSGALCLAGAVGGQTRLWRPCQAWSSSWLPAAALLHLKVLCGSQQGSSKAP